MRSIWRWLVGGLEPSWNQQIQSLKSESPMPLPAIKTLAGVIVKQRKAKKKTRHMDTALFRKRA